MTYKDNESEYSQFLRDQVVADWSEAHDRIIKATAGQNPSVEEEGLAAVVLEMRKEEVRRARMEWVRQHAAATVRGEVRSGKKHPHKKRPRRKTIQDLELLSE